MNDVAVVMPVYNEAECIGEVLQDWISVLNSLGINYRLIVLNDGSKDNTAEVLQKFDDNPCVMIINKKNTGHGPTILQGYHLAVAAAQWVFQVDSDNEIAAEHFKTLWQERGKYDAIIGIRANRNQPLARKIISAVSRLVVALFYGTGVTDVNCPFRLMRSEVLKEILKRIPEHTFAPNVAISGFLALSKAQISNQTVPHTNRQTGEVAIKKWKLMKAAMKSFLQVIRIRLNHH
jgi:glycosyltransferase involved in cell wall biosynthesis